MIILDDDFPINDSMGMYLIQDPSEITNFFTCFIDKTVLDMTLIL